MPCSQNQNTGATFQKQRAGLWASGTALGTGGPGTGDTGLPTFPEPAAARLVGNKEASLHTVPPAEEGGPEPWAPGALRTMAQPDSGSPRPTVSSSGMPLKAGWQRRAQTSKQSLEPERRGDQADWVRRRPVSLTHLSLCLAAAGATTRAQARQTPWTRKACPRGLHPHPQPGGQSGARNGRRIPLRPTPAPELRGDRAKLKPPVTHCSPSCLPRLAEPNKTHL